MFSFSGCIWKKYYLPLVWATQSMSHIVANMNFPMRDGRLLSRRVTSLPSQVSRDAWGEARPPASARVCRGGRLPLPLQQSLSIIVADMGRWRWCAPRVGTRGAGRKNHNCPAEPKLATMSLFPCHSVYLEFALHTLWVYALFICSLKSHAWKRKRRNPVT